MIKIYLKFFDSVNKKLSYSLSLKEFEEKLDEYDIQIDYKELAELTQQEFEKKVLWVEEIFNEGSELV